MTKLLFVDDEPKFEQIIRQRFRKEIKDHEYDIRFARNGDEALKIIDSDLPDLLLTDIKMPALQMDGFSLIKTLKHKNIYLKTIVISAYANMENYCEAIKENILFFIPKPFDIMGLKSLIDLAAATKPLELVKPLDTLAPIPASSELDSPSLAKLIKHLTLSQRTKLIETIIKTLSIKELKELQETLPELLLFQMQIVKEKKTNLEILQERQRRGEIPEEIPLEKGYRISKKNIKTNGVEYGPYYYISWSEDGKTHFRCVGLNDPLDPLD